jgi:hypothetical protein
MKLATDKVRHKEMSARAAAADTFSVPRSSLGDRLTKLKEGEMVKITPDMGWFRRTFIDELEEKQVSHIKDLDGRLIPLTREEFCILAYKLAENLKIPHPFNKQIKCAGKQLYYEFMRHPELSLRTSESTVCSVAYFKPSSNAGNTSLENSAYLYSCPVCTDRSIDTAANPSSPRLRMIALLGLVLVKTSTFTEADDTEREHLVVDIWTHLKATNPCGFELEM